MDRREFVLALSALSAAFVTPWKTAAAAAPPRPRDARSIYLDALFGPDGFETAFEGKFVPDPRLVQAIKERRIDIGSATHGSVGNAPDGFRDAVETIAITDRIISEHPHLFAKIESVADIRASVGAGKLGIIYNLQDTTALEADADRVAMLESLGIKIMQLTYNKRNLAGDGCLERSNAGLSDFGRQVITKINEARVLLDLSHGGQRTQAEAIGETKAPPAITHSGCRAVTDLPRNTHDAELRALSDKGGVFGIYLMPFLRIGRQAQREDLLAHVEHAFRVCGEDHIGIGTDGTLLGLTIDDKAREEQRKFYEQRAKAGIAAPGEGAEIFNIVEGYNSSDRFDVIAADLRRRGWPTSRIEKLLGANFVRLLGDVWGS